MLLLLQKLTVKVNLLQESFLVEDKVNLVIMMTMQLIYQPMNLKRITKQNLEKIRILIDGYTNYCQPSMYTKTPIEFICTKQKIICYNVLKRRFYDISWPKNHSNWDGSIHENRVTSNSDCLHVFFRNDSNEIIFGTLKLPAEINSASMTNLHKLWVCYKIRDCPELMNVTTISIREQNKPMWSMEGIINDTLYKFELRQCEDDNESYISCQYRVTHGLELQFPPIGYWQCLNGKWITSLENKISLYFASYQNRIVSSSFDNLENSGENLKHPVYFDIKLFPQNLTHKQVICYDSEEEEKMKMEYPSHKTSKSISTKPKQPIFTVEDFHLLLQQKTLRYNNNNTSEKYTNDLGISHNDAYRLSTEDQYEVIIIYDNIVLLLDKAQKRFFLHYLKTPVIWYDITNYDFIPFNRYAPDAIAFDATRHLLIVMRFDERSQPLSAKYKRKYQYIIPALDFIPLPVVIHHRVLREKTIQLLYYGLCRNTLNLNKSVPQDLIVLMSLFVNPFEEFLNIII